MRKVENIRLEKIAPKTGGKNNGSEIDGFYRDKEEKKEFFLKQPKDFDEFFAELLVGKIIQKFKDQGYIPKIYHDSLIVADVIDLGNDQFALIQPAVKMTELFKELNTGNFKNSDRSNFWEMLNGTSRYSIPFSQGNQYFGLSLAIMVSILVYDFTFHSGNVAKLKDSSQYTKFDFGSAFYKFVRPESHKDVLFSTEYEWMYKYYKKGYITYYANIPGFLDSVEEKAKEFHNNVSQNSESELSVIFSDIASQSLREIPTAFLERLSESDMQHFGFSEEDLKTFKTRRDQFFQDCFIPQFAKTLSLRLKKLMTLSESSIYQLYKTDRRMSIYQSIDLKSGQSSNSLVTQSLGNLSPKGLLPSLFGCSCCHFPTIKSQIRDAIFSEETKNSLLNPEKFLRINRKTQREDQKLEIKVVGYPVSLSKEGGGFSSINSCLRDELLSHTGKVARFLTIPLQIRDHHWVSLLVYINENNQLTQAYFIDLQLEAHVQLGQKFGEDILRQLKSVYPEFKGAVEEYLIDEDMETLSLGLAFKMLLFRANFGDDYKGLSLAVLYQSDEIIEHKCF